MVKLTCRAQDAARGGITWLNLDELWITKKWPEITFRLTTSFRASSFTCTVTDTSESHSNKRTYCKETGGASLLEITTETAITIVDSSITVRHSLNSSTLDQSPIVWRGGSARLTYLLPILEGDHNSTRKLMMTLTLIQPQVISRAKSFIAGMA
jgi:hypothetical protein